MAYQSLRGKSGRSLTRQLCLCPLLDDIIVCSKFSGVNIYPSQVLFLFTLAIPISSLIRSLPPNRFQIVYYYHWTHTSSANSNIYNILVTSLIIAGAVATLQSFTKNIKNVLLHMKWVKL